MSRRLLLLVTLAPLASAHGLDHDPLAEALVSDGHAQMLGELGFVQEGSLLVARPVADAAACRYDGPRIRVGEGSAYVGLNATHLAVTMDVPREGYAAVAADTGAAVRTLVLMRETAMSVHAVSARLLRGDVALQQAGALGMPHPLPMDAAPAGHAMIDIEPEGRGIRMSYQGERTLAPWCSPGHLWFEFARDGFATMREGSVVHLVLLRDDRLPHMLPLPVDGSTDLVEVNVYLPRAGEDAAQTARALAGRDDPTRAAVAALAALGCLVALVLPPRGAP